MPLVEFWNRATALLQKMGLPLNICQPTNVNDTFQDFYKTAYTIQSHPKQQFRMLYYGRRNQVI
jgi:hypothetical protein